MTLSARVPQFPSFTEFRQRLDLGAFIFAPYILVFVWQYFSVISSPTLAWALAVIVSLLISYLWVATKNDATTGKLSLWFWLVVALPLLLVFLMRVAFPDISFDVLNYHVFHSERALRGPLFIPGDFFPTPVPFNPSPDILTGLYRRVLGYRLGTIVNYLALIWTGAILTRLLRDYVRPPWLRSLAVLFVLCTEQILFQINNYMVDLLALPLLLEATILVINPIEGQQLKKRTWRLALLLGIAVAFKLTNLFFAVPIVLIYLFYLIRPWAADSKNQLSTLLKSAPLAAVFFILPSLPFLIFIYRLTGNPVFPVYNGLFKSPYWPQGTALDPRWGPVGIYETLIWPWLMYLKPTRLSEFNNYSGRLSLGYILSLLCLVIARGNRGARAIAFITLLGSLLWSASSGYIRYALYLELTSGVLLVWLCWYLWQKCEHFPHWGKLLAQAPLLVLVLGQGYFALRYTNRWEWSTRPTVFRNEEEFRHELPNLFRDRSLKSYVAADNLALFDNVDVWVETTYKTSVFFALLKPRTPVISLRMPNYFGTNEARQKLSQVLESTRGKRMRTLTTEDGLAEARSMLAARGLLLGKTQPVPFYYFSDSLKFDMLLAEVTSSWQNDSGSAKPERGLALPDMAFNAGLSAANMPSVMRAGQKYSVPVTLRNLSKVPWPGRQPEWKFQITVGNRWLTESGTNLNNTDGRAVLLQDLPPSEAVELLLNVTAPNQPGNYILQLDAIQEGVAWFGDLGSEILSFKVRVE